MVQSGGVGGLVKESQLDTGNLVSDEARTLENLVRHSGISTSGIYLSPTGRDLRQYDLTIEEGGGRIEATYDDHTLPAGARPLVAQLKRWARPARPPSREGGNEAAG
jgi:hypothetical protein